MQPNDCTKVVMVVITGGSFFVSFLHPPIGPGYRIQMHSSQIVHGSKIGPNTVALDVCEVSAKRSSDGMLGFVAELPKPGFLVPIHGTKSDLFAILADLGDTAGV